MLEKNDILSIISSELSLSDYDSSDNSLEESLDLYLGNPLGNEVEGRSQVVSTDVADAIEWIMPQIMKSFTQNNEIVIFDPVNEEDERQAELESEYVYEVLMKQNDGFIVLHQFIKDALMQRNGIIKTYYAEKTETKVKQLTGLSEQQLEQVLVQSDVELLSQEQIVDESATIVKQQEIEQQLLQIQQQMQQSPQDMSDIVAQLNQEYDTPVYTYNIEFSVNRVKGKIYVDPVPPEEFRVNSNHNSINLDNARFTAHVTNQTLSDIRELYDVDEATIEELGTGRDYSDTDYRFAAQDETVSQDDESLDPSMTEIEVAECYLKIDIDETGIAKLMKIVVAGGDNPTHILAMDEIDTMPWTATTAFIMSHKFYGLSITDRLKQLQLIKTALWRNMLDNIYLQNNQRHVVLEGQINMEDMMVSRPGGIIRAKRLDAITPLATPQLSSDAFTMMEYIDRVRAGRTGVDAEGNATPQNIGDRVGSQGVDRMMNAKEELVGLIIRVVAETGVKPLMTKIRDLTVKHINAVLDFKFRGVWQQINPALWPDRLHSTARVGTGSGNHEAKLNAIREVIVMQEKAMQFPGQYVIDAKQMYGAVDDFCKLSGLNGATKYFIDPDSPAGIAKKQEEDQKAEQASQKNEQMQQAMAEAQLKLAEAEMQKVRVQQEAVQLKTQVDTVKNQLKLQEQSAKAQIDSLKAQLEQSKLQADAIGKIGELELKQYDIDNRTALELTRIEKDSQREENENFQQNKESVAPDGRE